MYLLRSFPHCTNKHVSKQFCGGPLLCNITLAGDLANTPSEHLLVIGEFMTQELFLSELEGRMSHTLHFDHFVKERKTISSMFGRFYEGVLVPSRLHHVKDCSKSVFTYQFNAELAGWNYGWQSNKHKTKDWHVFQISVYFISTSRIGNCLLSCKKGLAHLNGSSVSEESFSLILRSASPQFRILSARR